MWDHVFIYLFIFHNVGFAECAYQPMGVEVQAGSVLLPASRRGRYLANIARRQAVDGTGIKFNKDADRMNAEAKKKVDVLSEELLPYIIAEQERRVTLYKRVMTAIQNGEKGVTIAEIRNKPPTIIRKGLMYRCPTNRPPREPDGSGSIICEEDLKPTPIMFESCLSAEDRELYVAENKYFFCNRHKVEGPDLPRNGTMVIGCAPCERTPLNYTTQKCALEDTDDVVVHYRYYPDRTYKFVSELDPMREVCEHWNPCQIGYIFSLPGPDQATLASELWQDSMFEMVPVANVGQNYTTSMRLYEYSKLKDEGFKFQGIGHKYNASTKPNRLVPPTKNMSLPENLSIDYKVLDKYVKITIKFHPLLEKDYTRYYAFFHNFADRSQKLPIFLNLRPALTKLTPKVLYAMPGQQLNLTSVEYACEQCALEGIVLRATDGSFRNLELDKFHLRDTQKVIEFKFGMVKMSDFGDYFLVIRNDVGSEERIKAISIKVISLESIRKTATVGKPVDISTTYKCVGSCELVDVLCNGESALASGGVEHIATAKRIRLDFARFEDENACVYLAKFKIGDDFYMKNVAIVDKVEVKPIRVDSPVERTSRKIQINYKCNHPDCRLKKVTVNGSPLDTKSSAIAFYSLGDGSVFIDITEYSTLYEGFYQGVFELGTDLVTKTLLEIRPDGIVKMNYSTNDTDYLEEGPLEGDWGDEATLRDGEPEKKQLSPPGTRRSAADANKSTP